MKRISLLFAAALLLLGGLAHAADARVQLQAFSKGLQGIDGQFSQQVFDAQGHLKERANGRVALSAPRLFRWEYVKPYPQLIVADGKTVWVYDPDLNQATRRAQGPEEANSPLAILLDPGKLERGFIVKELGAKAGVDWLEITPRNADAAFKSARLGFEAGSLSQLSYVDALGQRTEIHFRNWQRNPVFAKDMFVFVPAPGIDVIGG